MKQNKLNILLVEDDKINQMIACTYLRKWGMDVTIAQNGKEALVHILDKNFQLLLMDIQMPVMDGFETTTIIRAIDEHYFKTVPIIGLSAGLLTVKKEAIQHGMSDLIFKPFEPEELKNKIMDLTKTSLEPRPLLMDFDSYTDGDPNFKIELISLLIGNLRELQRSLFNAAAQKGFDFFLYTCHKVKSTVCMLQDKELEHAIEDLKALVMSGHGKVKTLYNSKLSQFNRLCDHVIESLKSESNKLMKI